MNTIASLMHPRITVSIRICVESKLQMASGGKIIDVRPKFALPGGEIEILAEGFRPDGGRCRMPDNFVVIKTRDGVIAGDVARGR